MEPFNKIVFQNLHLHQDRSRIEGTVYHYNVRNSNHGQIRNAILLVASDSVNIIACLKLPCRDMSGGTIEITLDCFSRNSQNPVTLVTLSLVDTDRMLVQNPVYRYSSFYTACILVSRYKYWYRYL